MQRGNCPSLPLRQGGEFGKAMQCGLCDGSVTGGIGAGVVSLMFSRHELIDGVGKSEVTVVAVHWAPACGREDRL